MGDPSIWFSLLALTVLELVLGVDNLVFIAITSDRLPQESQPLVWRIGLLAALVARLALLTAMVWVLGLASHGFTVLGHTFTWRDLILLLGGLFLIFQGVREIRHELGGGAAHKGSGAAVTSVAGAVAQIALLDIVFSLDSVLTAIGMADHVWVMATAILVAVGVMLAASGPIMGVVNRHPRVKMLALAVLLLIGATLVLEGVGVLVPKPYVYAAIAFAAGVEALQHFAVQRRKARPH